VVEQMFRNQVMSTIVALFVRETAAFLCVVSHWSVTRGSTEWCEGSADI
jgi:hypothetical protein